MSPISTNSGHTLVPMDEEKQYLVTGINSRSLETPINNNDYHNNSVKLLDISCNKEWIAYISTSRTEYYPGTANYKTSITRRRFNTLTTGREQEHFSLAINDNFFEEKGEGKNHCEFLSISPDGIYMAISFFVRNQNARDSSNPFCLLYKLTSNGIELWNKIKFQGRAVFMNHNLALINANFLEVYNPATCKQIYWFDLRSLNPSSSFHDRIESHNSFIKNASWVKFIGRDNENGDMKRLITCTRHARDQVLVTPFKGGVVRVWSILDGNRLASFIVQPNEHVMAFSNDNKLIATYTEGLLIFNVYDVKSGLIIYSLAPRCQGRSAGVQFEVSHLRFCFDDQYLVMSGLEKPKQNAEKGRNKRKVVFEAWHLKSGKSISYEERPFDLKQLSPEFKYVQPFVTKGYNQRGEKCLYGVYTTIENNATVTNRLELDIDRMTISDKIMFEWVNDNTVPYFTWELEFENNLNQFDNLKCGHIRTVEDGKKYLLRFGYNMVQMWHLHDPNCYEDDPISELDQLLYIRAYKGPKYGFDYSFRDRWVVDKFESIKYIGGYPNGRLVVNIRKDEEYNAADDRSGPYHTEEIFLPLDQLAASKDNILYDYHQIESACQALHYQHVINQEPATTFLQSEDQFFHNRDLIFKKTKELTSHIIEGMRGKSNFFTTVSGSQTLAMLASFSEGKDIIQKILLYGDIPIRVFSYPRSYSEMNKYTQKYDDEWLDFDRENEEDISRNFGNQSRSSIVAGASASSLVSTLSYRSSPTGEEATLFRKRKRLSHAVAVNENVLTILAEESCHLLFRLLFNRVLYDSKEIGIGCLTAMTDTIFFLQSMQRAKGDSFYTLMVNCIEKLTFLSVNPDTLALLKSELVMYQYKNAFSSKYSSSLIYLDSFSVKEQITKYKNSSILDHVYYTLLECARRTRQYFFYQKDLTYERKLKKREWIASQLIKGKQKWSSYQQGQYSEGPAGLSLLCVVPLIGFNSFQTDFIKLHKQSSVFERMVTDTHNKAIFEEGGNVIDILLQNKWKNFARAKFALMFSIYLVFFVFYIVNVSFSHLVFAYEPGTPITSIAQIICTSIMFGFIAVIFLQNMRRLIICQNKLDYFESMFNCFEVIAVVIVPILSFLCMLFDWPYRKEGISTCTLILWFHAIFKLRIFPFIGVTLETIIQLWRSIAPVFAVTLLVICAFTNAFMVLLYDQDDTYFQEKYVGNSTTSVPPPILNDMAMQDTSQNNQFGNAFRAFFTVWFFMYGVWDPAVNGDAGDNIMIMILSTLFTFFTVLIFFNLIIARMSGAVERVTKLGDKIWITHFASVLSEIELLWCSERRRQSRKNNPEYVFYNANAVSIQKHGLKLREETDKLKVALELNHEFVEDFGAD